MRGTVLPETGMQIERYGVYWVNLDPIVGREIRRPAVVVSDEAMNRHLDTVVVCPLTSNRHHRWRSRVGCTVGGIDGEIAIDQIRTVSPSDTSSRRCTECFPFQQRWTDGKRSIRHSK